MRTKPKQQMQIWQILQRRLLSSQKRKQQQHQVDKHAEPVVTMHTCGLPGLLGLWCLCVVLHKEPVPESSSKA